MRRGIVSTLLLSLSVTLNLSTSSTAGSDLQPAYILRHFASETIVDPDGTSTSTVHTEVEATNDSAARRLGERSVPFSESMEDLEIVEALTRKRDGQELPVNPSAIFIQAPQGSSNAPMFSDRKNKVIVFPNVGAGDVASYTVRIHAKIPPTPGHFSWTRTVSPLWYVEDWRETMIFPRSMPATAETHQIAHSMEERGDKIAHIFTYRQTSPLLEDRALLSAYDYAPRYFISTFASHAELARAYAQLSAGKAVVTPRVRALAEQIAGQTSDRREQARLIYGWVSANIRYVAISLTNGGLEPHDVETILQNSYGDCKDHTVVFQALLAALSIDSHVVLINSDNAYSISDIPTFSPLNHAITYLPEFELYADTTAEVAPFGVLPLTEYDKPALHIGGEGSVLRRTPTSSSKINEATLRTEETLLSDGRIVGRTELTSTGSFGISLRQQATWIEARGGKAAASEQLRFLKRAGTGDFAFSAPRRDLALSYAVSGDFELEADANYLSGEPFAPPIGLALLSRPGVTLLGPSGAAATESAPCHSGHQVEEVRLKLPPDRDIVRLPKGRMIKDDWLLYQSSWDLADGIVSVRREATVGVETDHCTEAIRKILADDLTHIEDDYRTAISLKKR